MKQLEIPFKTKRENKVKTSKPKFIFITSQGDLGRAIKPDTITTVIEAKDGGTVILADGYKFYAQEKYKEIISLIK